MVIQKGMKLKESSISTVSLTYREKLVKELKIMRDSEMWKTGAKVRKLRPEKTI